MIKSKEYRDFEAAVHEQLWPSLKEIKEFASHVNSGHKYISAEYQFYIKGVITAKGTVSKRCIDVSNAVKIIEDCLFNQLGVDDGLVVQLSATKIESEENKMVVKLNAYDVTNIA